MKIAEITPCTLNSALTELQMLPQLSGPVYPIILRSHASLASVLNCWIVVFKSALSSFNIPAWNQTVSRVFIWVPSPESVVGTLTGGRLLPPEQPWWGTKNSSSQIRKWISKDSFGLLHTVVFFLGRLKQWKRLLQVAKSRVRNAQDLPKILRKWRLQRLTSFWPEWKNSETDKLFKICI